MTDEHSDGEADAALGEREEPTVVVVRRITRSEVSAGVRKLASACGGFRRGLYEGAEFLDEGTAAGLEALTYAEAADLAGFLEDIEEHVRGVRVALKRAVGPEPTEDP